MTPTDLLDTELEKTNYLQSAAQHSATEPGLPVGRGAEGASARGHCVKGSKLSSISDPTPCSISSQPANTAFYSLPERSKLSQQRAFGIMLSEGKAS